MREINKIIFVGKSGTCREPMAMELLKRQHLWHPVEVEARGYVVLFPEPINQKAEAVMISNGITIGKYMSSQLLPEDFGDDTLVLTFSQESREKVLGIENARNVFVLTDVTGDELEILNPYGAELVTYGLCFETLENTIRKLAEVLNDGIYFAEEPAEETKDHSEEKTKEITEDEAKMPDQA